MVHTDVRLAVTLKLWGPAVAACAAGIAASVAAATKLARSLFILKLPFESGWDTGRFNQECRFASLGPILRGSTKLTMESVTFSLFSMVNVSYRYQLALTTVIWS